MRIMSEREYQERKRFYIQLGRSQMQIEMLRQQMKRDTEKHLARLDETIAKVKGRR